MKKKINAKINAPSHTTDRNIFDDLGFPPEKAAALKIKARLFDDILERARRFTPSQLQTMLNEPQPRISELLHGKISKVSIEKLINYAVRLGGNPEVRIKKLSSARVLKNKRSRRPPSITNSRVITPHIRG